MCTVSVLSPDNSYYKKMTGAKSNFESMFQQERNLSPRSSVVARSLRKRKVSGSNSTVGKIFFFIL